MFVVGPGIVQGEKSHRFDISNGLDCNSLESVRSAVLDRLNVGCTVVVYMSGPAFFPASFNVHRCPVIIAFVRFGKHTVVGDVVSSTRIVEGFASGGDGAAIEH